MQAIQSTMHACSGCSVVGVHKHTFGYVTCNDICTYVYIHAARLFSTVSTWLIHLTFFTYIHLVSILCTQSTSRDIKYCISGKTYRFGMCLVVLTRQVKLYLVNINKSYACPYSYACTGYIRTYVCIHTYQYTYVVTYRMYGKICTCIHVYTYVYICS